MAIKDNDVGIVYVAFGRAYLAMALLSASSARQLNPHMPICIVTNVHDGAPAVPFWDASRDRIIFLDEDVSRNRNIKTRLNQYSPFAKSIFLDCDTKVLGDLSLAGPILDYFDVAMRLNRQPQRVAGKGDVQVLGGIRVVDLPHWNSGVILFGSGDAVDELFDRWSSTYEQMAVQYDQVSLVDASFRSRARLLSLDYRWNATDPVLGRGRWRREAKVFHYASNISGKLFAEILRMDATIPDERGTGNSETTRAFLVSKRQSKLHSVGWSKYLMLRVLWAMSSPV